MEALYSFLTGIAGAALTFPIQHKLANLKALETVEKVYGNLIKTLEDRVQGLENEVERWKAMRCENRTCKNRRPPLNENNV